MHYIGKGTRVGRELIYKNRWIFVNTPKMLINLDRNTDMSHFNQIKNQPIAIWWTLPTYRYKTD